jgi:hypothetical protein
LLEDDYSVGRLHIPQFYNFHLQSGMKFEKETDEIGAYLCIVLKLGHFERHIRNTMRFLKFFKNSFIVQRLFTLVQKQGFQNCSLNQFG